MIEDDGLPSAFTTAHELGKARGGALRGLSGLLFWAVGGHKYFLSMPGSLTDSLRVSLILIFA